VIVLSLLVLSVLDERVLLLFSTFRRFFRFGFVLKLALLLGVFMERLLDGRLLDGLLL